MAVRNHIQHIRGDSAKNDEYTGLHGEITVDDTNKSIRVHDGNTKGGTLLARLNQVPTKISQLENDKGYIQSGGSEIVGPTTCPTADPSDISKVLANTEWVSKATCVVHTTGDETINGVKTFTSDINGTALRAKWADLAENYISDCRYPSGTLIEFGGEKEITIATTKVNGVVSSKPGLLINDDRSSDQCLLPVAMTGRVPVAVIGSVKKHDLLVLGQQGVAVVDNTSSSPIAIALEDNLAEQLKLVLAVTNLRLI